MIFVHHMGPIFPGSCDPTRVTIPPLPGEQDDHPPRLLYRLGNVFHDLPSGHEVPLVENELEAVVVLQDRGQVWVPFLYVWVVILVSWIVMVVSQIVILGVILSIFHENLHHLTKVIGTASIMTFLDQAQEIL